MISTQETDSSAAIVRQTSISSSQRLTGRRRKVGRNRMPVNTSGAAARYATSASEGVTTGWFRTSSIQAQYASPIAQQQRLSPIKNQDRRDRRDACAWPAARHNTPERMAASTLPRSSTTIRKGALKTPPPRTTSAYSTAATPPSRAAWFTRGMGRARVRSQHRPTEHHDQRKRGEPQSSSIQAG